MIVQAQVKTLQDLMDMTQTIIIQGHSTQPRNVPGYDIDTIPALAAWILSIGDSPAGAPLANIVNCAI